MSSYMGEAMPVAGAQVRLDNGAVVTFVKVVDDGKDPRLVIVEFNDRPGDRAIVALTEIEAVDPA